MAVMSNLAFNILEGERLFMRNPYKFSLKVSLLLCHLEKKSEKKFLIEFFTITKITSIK